MQLLRNSNPNLTVGIFLLILLAVFAGPNTLPRLLSTFFPGADEATSCSSVRTADNRAQHQSLLGRAADSPIALSVRTTALPTQGDQFLTIIITVTNDSLGTVPFVFNPNQVIVGDDGSSGVGLIFTPANSLQSGARQDSAATYAEQNIRVLGPRQRCVVRIDFPAGNVLVDGNVTSGTAQVRAFYRNGNPGPVAPPPGTNATPIFPNQGLWTGIAESENVTIPPA